jgi:hypothetical protein
MYYTMDDDGGGARQIILDVLEGSGYMLSKGYDATRRGKSRKRTRLNKRRGKVTYGKGKVRDSKESCKGVEELAEGSPFPLASK